MEVRRRSARVAARRRKYGACSVRDAARLCSGAVSLLFALLTAVVVVVIALVSVGRAGARLRDEPPPSLFDLDEAVTFVADRLPVRVAGQVSYDDVRSIIGFHLDYLEAKGIAVEADELAEGAVRLPDLRPAVPRPGRADVARERGRAHGEVDARDVPTGGGDEDGSVRAGEAGGFPIVADDHEGLAFVLGKVADAALDVADTDVVEVLEVAHAYLGAIGAIGGAVDPPAAAADTT